MKAEDLEVYNPWWRTGRVREDWLKPYRRELYAELLKHVDRRQALLVQGLRRVGKTTLMMQVIQSLLEKTPAKNILYFSFDEKTYDIKQVVETYQELVLGKLLEEEKDRVYLFMDEIHKVSDWENKIKTYYDLYPNLKFFLLGSASIALRKRSKESLAGRVFDFTLEPLSFKEFLEINGHDVREINSRPAIWARTVLPLFYKYLKYGSFPELVHEENEEAAKKYILNDVVERIIYKDIQEEFNARDFELLKALVYLLGKNPGMLLNYRKLAHDLGRDQRTIANYFEYIEFGLLTRFVFNYRGSPLASMRKLKKAYFTTPNIAFAIGNNFDHALPALLENAVAAKTKAKFFYKNSFEVDFVVEKGGGLEAIEVKTGDTSTRQLLKFAQEFGSRAKKLSLVTLEKEESEKRVKTMPAWRFLLDENARQ